MAWLFFGESQVGEHLSRNAGDHKGPHPAPHLPRPYGDPFTLCELDASWLTLAVNLGGQVGPLRIHNAQSRTTSNALLLLHFWKLLGISLFPRLPGSDHVNLYNSHNRS